MAEEAKAESTKAGVVRPKRRRSVRVLVERLLLGSIMSVIAVMVDRRLRRAFSKPDAASPPPADQVSKQDEGEQPAHRSEQHADPSGDTSETRGQPADQE
jgi:hypothetical protein